MDGSHAGHNHSAHAAPDTHAVGADMAGMDMSSGVVRLPGGGYTYSHGAFTGHVVPGAFFVVWGLWWTVCTFGHYLQSLASNRPFRTRGWRSPPWGPAALRRLPLEPLLKVLLPPLAILGELWLGHESWRNLYDPSSGKFAGHMNDWQHSTMYLAFMASGVVDLMGHWLGGPPAAELAFLALSFMAQGVLLVFHLKGPLVEIRVHLILALQVFATVAAILVEMAAPSSILAASARPWLTTVQGIWWIVTAYIMYTNAPQWDPDYMGSGMMVPVPWVLWSLGVAFAMFCLLLAMKAVAERRLGRPLSFDPELSAALQLQHPQHRPLSSQDEDEGDGAGNGYGRGAGGDLEMSGLIKPFPGSSHAGRAG